MILHIPSFAYDRNASTSMDAREDATDA
jgi:hypothetical protein